MKHYLQNMWISTILDDFLKILLQNFSFFGIFSWVFWFGKQSYPQRPKFSSPKIMNSACLFAKTLIFSHQVVCKSTWNLQVRLVQVWYLQTTCYIITTNAIRPIFSSCLQNLNMKAGCTFRSSLSAWMHCACLENEWMKKVWNSHNLNSSFLKKTGYHDLNQNRLFPRSFHFYSKNCQLGFPPKVFHVAPCEKKFRLPRKTRKKP